MLKIGVIDYLNVYPLYKYLIDKCEFCNFIFGEPSDLNYLILSGKIDIAPSSSYEFLKNKDSYTILENFSISSRKKILSVIFITKKSIEEYKNSDVVYLSQSSASSNNLLKIIFFEFFKIFPQFEYVENNFKKLNNQLLIGDSALEFYFHNKINSYKIYDLAELWYKYTKFPFVFALWIGNVKNIKKKSECVDIFKKILKKSIRSYIIPDRYKNFTSEQIQEYFQYIDYEFFDLHKKSLNLYERLLKKWNLI